MYKVAKRYKKIVVVDENDVIVYHPPNFLKPITSRNDMQIVVDSFNEKGYNGDAITEFETKFSPRIQR